VRSARILNAIANEKNDERRQELVDSLSGQE
jgi:hypothetical protein